MSDGLSAPFPYFGGKSRIAAEVWDRFGDVANYVEPFFGSGAVLLARPTEPGIETVNDKDGFVANFWRAVRADPEAVASWADWPVNEIDQHARHLWLVERVTALERLMLADPDWFDVQVAGWWVWGVCCWIGTGWCSGDGPWRLLGGELVNVNDARKLPHLGDAGRGIHRKLPHLGDAGRGIHRQLPHLGSAGQGIRDWFNALADRLRRVRVCCGDWTRVLGPTPTVKQGLTAVFLDPPYSLNGRDDVYRRDDGDVAAEVRAWAIEHGGDPLLRIALCGYEGEHEMPADWEALSWKAKGGYGSQGEGRGRENAEREMVWFSPHCLKASRPRALELFA